MQKGTLIGYFSNGLYVITYSLSLLTKQYCSYNFTPVSLRIIQVDLGVSNAYSPLIGREILANTITFAVVTFCRAILRI